MLREENKKIKTKLLVILMSLNMLKFEATLPKEFLSFLNSQSGSFMLERTLDDAC